MYISILELVLSYCTFVDLLKFKELNKQCYNVFSLDNYWSKILDDCFKIDSEKPFEKFKEIYNQSYLLTPKKKQLLDDYFVKKESKDTTYIINDSVGFTKDEIKRVFKYHSKGYIDIKIFDLCYMNSLNQIKYCTLTLYSNIQDMNLEHILNISIRESQNKFLELYYYKNVRLDIYYDVFNRDEFIFSMKSYVFNFKRAFSIHQTIKFDNKLRGFKGDYEFVDNKLTCKKECIIFKFIDFYVFYFNYKVKRYESLVEMYEDVSRREAKAILSIISDYF